MKAYSALWQLACLGFLGVSSAWAADEVTPIDPATGKVMVAPQDSSLSEYVTSAPPNPNPPPYTTLRYTEHYAYLADPAKRRDVFDALKYLPLMPDNPESYLSFGGEFRERFEHYNNPGFGARDVQESNIDLQRILLHADLHLNERLRLFAQGISSLQFGAGPSAAVNQNPLDLQQAFADYTFGDPSIAGERLTIRGGRFSMTYGAGRLVATRAAPNTPLKFDGFQLIGSLNNRTKLYAFISHPVLEQKHQVSNTNYAQSFSGIYAGTPLGGLFNTNIDVYYLLFKNQTAKFANAAGVETRHSTGIRLYGNKDDWDYDLESVLQFGSLGNQDIQAWTVGTDFGYRFRHIAWTPRLGLKADVASGNTHNGAGGSVGTFNPLFFKAGYFNDAAVISPSNIADVHISWQMQPREDLSLVAGSDLLWRYSRYDALYSPNGNILLPAKSASAYVGTTLEAALQWTVNRHLVGTLSYVHIFTGNYVQQSGGTDIDYLASWLSYTW